jgi:hypothetical protein
MHKWLPFLKWSTISSISRCVSMYGAGIAVSVLSVLSVVDEIPRLWIIFKGLEWSKSFPLNDDLA